MRRNSIRYINTSNENSVQQTGSVVYGSFPKYNHKKTALEKLNKFLNCVLLLLVAVSLVSYYFVSDSESRMNKLGRDIEALAGENIELQNKLDNLHSFNKVDEFIKNNSALNTAERIIEIPSAAMAEIDVRPPEPDYRRPAGY